MMSANIHQFLFHCLSLTMLHAMIAEFHIAFHIINGFHHLSALLEEEFHSSIKDTKTLKPKRHKKYLIAGILNVQQLSWES